MRPRIFTLLLMAFGLVIVCGVLGSATLFWLAFASSPQRYSSLPQMQRADAVVEELAGFYQRTGSWVGVQARVIRLGEDEAQTWQVVTLIDIQGIVVGTSRPNLIRLGQFYSGLPPLGDIGVPAEPAPPTRPHVPNMFATIEARNSRGEPTMYGRDGDLMRGARFEQTLPVTLDGQQIGTLLISVDRARLAASGASAARRGAQGVASAMVGLALILLGLAAFFSGRLSRPIRQISRAAQALAAGNMAARAEPAAVRELGELATSFNRMADALLQADEQRRQLTADVAHELRTPLSIIKGRLEGIQDGVYTPDAPQINGLLGEVALLERLIDDLRLLALAEAGQLELYTDQIDPAYLALEAQRSFGGHASERGVALELALAADLPEIQADPQRIAQVLGNLIGNALRHTPAGGQVVVALACANLANGNPAVCFSVRDTGGGIAPADLPRIFDRFYRADRSRTRSSGGAGLGLAIARRIIEAHGGQIWAESDLGHGTTVFFSVPVA